MRIPLLPVLLRRGSGCAAMILSTLLMVSGDAEAQQVLASDSSAVIEVVERYHQALAAGDGATAMALLAPGAIILESGGMESREEYESHHLPADIRFARAVTRERGPLHVRVEGDVAWTASTSRSVGTFGEREIDSRGAELMVLRRTAEGWRIEAIHWSSR